MVAGPQGMVNVLSPKPKEDGGDSGMDGAGEVKDGRVTFRLEDGRKLELASGDPQLRHLDHAWASTVHAFQGRTVDNVIAAMEANHPHLTTQKSFYVEISRARDRAELVTDDRVALKEQLEAATGERIAALEGIGGMPPRDGGAGRGDRANGRRHGTGWRPIGVEGPGGAGRGAGQGRGDGPGAVIGRSVIVHGRWRDGIGTPALRVDGWFRARL